MKYRSLLRSYKSVDIEMNGNKLKQAFPLTGVDHISPFVLLHHFDFLIEPGDSSFYVAPHPHRGFAPVTFMFEGSVEHRDSFGNQKVINRGEVQWINAARGIIHSEKASQEMIETGGRYQGVQLWINLPSSEKMNPASYHPIDNETMMIIHKEDVEIRLVSGEFEGKRGAVKSNNITIMSTMKKNSNYSFDLPEKDNTVIYVVEGEIFLNAERKFKASDVLWFNKEQGEILIEAKKDTKLLVLSGQPIDEPLVSHGPYVMNSQTEILEAMRDYKNGKMGYL